MTMANTLAYFDTATIMAVKKLVVQAPAQERKRLRVVTKETFPIEISSAGKPYKTFCKVYINFGFYFMIYSLV
jgi:hypothetical protein